MEINIMGLGNIGNFTPLPQITRLDKPDAEIALSRGESVGAPGKDADFGALVSGGVNKVNRAVSEFEGMSARFAEGERVNLHELMVKGEQADMSLRLMLSVRNKVVEAYQEVMRLQV